ncbi:RHS repeat protein [Massilia sp. YMA4]|nr:RHS repeat protein [Massilia sp. YMA4]
MEKSDDQGNSESYIYTPREIYNGHVRADGPELVWDRKIWTADLAQRVIVRNGATYKTIYSNYDSYGNVGTVTESGPSGETRTVTRSYYIDPARWIVNQVKDEVGPDDTTTRAFNTFGDLLSLNSNGIITSHTYDAEGNIASTTFPRGLTHTYSNYKRGIAQNESQPEGVTITRLVDDAGNVTSETNGEGRTTLYGYDLGGRVTSITPPTGTQTSIRYATNSKEVSRGALVENTAYDGFGRTSSVTLGGITHTYRYDALGRKIFASDADSSAGTSYDFDTLNRVVRVTHADGTSQRTVYSGATKTVYDERNNPTTYTYRSYGDPSELYLMAITPSDAIAGTAIVRDNRNLVSSVTQGGMTRSYTYNASHQLVSATNPETGTTIYGRDPAGNMTTRAVGASGTTTYTYDGQNRLTNVTYPGKTPAVTKTYTKTGKLKVVSSSAAIRTYQYDPNDNLASETISVDGINFTTKYTYNGNDQLDSITYPASGRIVRYQPDVLGRPTIVGTYVTGVEYWPSGMVKQISYGNGTVSAYAQHARLWPASFYTGRAGTPFMNSQYAYDGAGNITSITDSIDGSNSRAMGFDKINRLTSISGPWGDGSITYSPNGNITSQILGNQGLYYNYDNANRLTSVSGTRATSYSYDAYGNITMGSARTFDYDGVPNLRCVNCFDSTLKVEYVYDGLNQRVMVKKAGVKTYEIYGSHGNQLMSYTPGTTPKLVEYIYLGGKRVAQRVGL